MIITKKIVKLMSGIAIALASLNASAHHSAAGYDIETRVSVTGEVAKASFRNPHGVLDMTNATSEGFKEGAPAVTAHEFHVETAAANLLRRRGWKFNEVKKGMKVTLVGHPTKDGSAQLYLREIHFEDGTVFGDPEGNDKALD